MKKLLTAAFAAIVGVTSVSFAPMTASAAPVVPLIQQDDAASDVIQVQGDGRWSGRDGGFYNNRRIIRRNWAGNRGFYNRGGIGYYNGHRGYREYRRGYRRHGDFWFPAGAFIAGAVIGGVLAAPGPTYYEPRPVYRRVVRTGNAHVQWCYNRYRSYDAYSDTFQPYNGPRQRCYSPYS